MEVSYYKIPLAPLGKLIFTHKYLNNAKIPIKASSPLGERIEMRGAKLLITVVYGFLALRKAPSSQPSPRGEKGQ